MNDADHAWLTVQGTRIVTSAQSSDGVQPFVPMGLGYCRDVCIAAQDEQVMQYCKQRHLNTVRLAFYTRYFNNTLDRPIDIVEHLRNHIDPVVQAAKRHGLYVILDDHGYFSEQIDEATARQKQKARLWDDRGVDEWIARWVKVAEAYRDEPHVLGYELLNEPHDIRTETVREWYGRCIKAIRKVDTRHIVLVGSADWSHARSLESTWAPVAKTLDAPHNRVVFTFHDYPNDNHPWIVEKHVTSFRDKYDVPVLCTEFGALPGPGEAASRKFLTGMLSLFAKEDIGWMVWTLWGLNDRYSTPPSRGGDSCPYTDLWVPAAQKMSNRAPQPNGEPREAVASNDPAVDPDRETAAEKALEAALRIAFEHAAQGYQALRLMQERFPGTEAAGWAETEAKRLHADHVAEIDAGSGDVVSGD